MRIWRALPIAVAASALPACASRPAGPLRDPSHEERATYLRYRSGRKATVVMEGADVGTVDLPPGAPEEERGE